MKASEKLKSHSETETQLRLALDAAGMVTWEWDIPADMIRYSDNAPVVAAGKTLTPYCSAEGLLQRVHPDDRKGLRQALHRTTTTSAPFDCEYRVLMQDGLHHWIHGQGRIVAMKRGRPVRMLGVSQDITDRKTAETALREQDALLRSFYDSPGAGRGIVEMTDRGIRVVSANRVLSAAYDRAPKLMHNIDAAELGVPQPLIDRWIAAARQSIATGVPVSFEYSSAFRAPGTWGLATISSLGTAESGRPRFAFITLDITDRKRAEQELLKRSHQLAVLASELTLAEHRQRRQLAERVHDHLQQLLVGARMQGQALLSRQEAGGRPLLDSVLAALTEALAETRAITQELAPPVLLHKEVAGSLRWLAEDMQRRHRLRVSLQLRDAPGDMDEALRVLLYSAARELLFNVVKHAGTSRATLRLRRDGGLIVLEVKDKGMGLNSTGVQPNADASGFGLFSIRERAELLGGRLVLTSAPGRGTRATLTLPLSAGPPEAAGAVTDPSARPPPADRRKPATARTRIRIVFADDHRTVREAIANLLREQTDLDVVGEADNGRQAVARVQRLRPDVVLMDVSMPVMDGIQATRAIRRRWPSVRIIALSMHEDNSAIERMRSAGAADYVAKSDPPEHLIAAIRRCATPRRHRGQPLSFKN